MSFFERLSGSPSLEWVVWKGFVSFGVSYHKCIGNGLSFGSAELRVGCKGECIPMRGTPRRAVVPHVNAHRVIQRTQLQSSKGGQRSEARMTHEVIIKRQRFVRSHIINKRRKKTKERYRCCSPTFRWGGQAPYSGIHLKCAQHSSLAVTSNTGCICACARWRFHTVAVLSFRVPTRCWSLGKKQLAHRKKERETPKNAFVPVFGFPHLPRT